MIYLEISGNCGNQFFQYAFARKLQIEYGGDLIIDYGQVISDRFALEESDNLLKKFNTTQYKYVTDNTFMPHKRLVKYSKKLINLFKSYSMPQYYCQVLLARFLEKNGVYIFGSGYYQYRFDSKSKDIYIGGYFESPRYFREIEDIIQRELTPVVEMSYQNRELYRRICDNESVCISIKRMSVECGVADIQKVYAYNMAYYYKAVDYLRSKLKNPIWIIFSDNIEWCKDNFHIEGCVYYENDMTSIPEKISLMAACKHFVIHNSTFSWWAQHLSGKTDRIVIAPQKWLQAKIPIDLYEECFVVMDNDGRG